MKKLALLLAAAISVALFPIQGHAQVHGINKIYTSGETSIEGPPTAFLNGRLYIAWSGVDPQHHLNVMMSSDDGHSFGSKYTGGDTSDSGPSLVVHQNRLFIAWRGSGNNQLNVAEVALNGSGAPVSLTGKYTSGETTTSTPALTSTDRGLFISWRGVGNNQLNVGRVDVR
jgi:hypothetical protein